MSENTNDSANPVLTFEGKKYLINELSNEIKESIKVLQIAETQLKMHQDTLKLLTISRNSLVKQLREKLTLIISFKSFLRNMKLKLQREDQIYQGVRSRG